MAIREIQLPELAGVMTCDFVARCGKADYAFTLQWSDELAKWTLTCATAEGAPVWSCRPVAAGGWFEPPLWTADDWILFCTSNSGAEPTQVNFGPGKDCTLLVDSAT